MIIKVLLLILQLSITVHVYYIVQFVLKKESRYLRRFINTAVTNMILAGTCMALAISRPHLLREVNLRLIIWLMSGFVMSMMLYIKIIVLRTIYKRSKDPDNFHYNYFGKKVLDAKVVKEEELYVFLFTIPFFLIAGAYFVARLINFIMYGRL